jgi:hypothetical protein
MKERKWWNGVARVPVVWWRSSSLPSRQESDEQASQPEESPKILKEPVAENSSKTESLPQLSDDALCVDKTDAESRRCDDVLAGNSGRHSLDASARVTGNSSRNSVPRALSTPPRRRKEFIVEGIPDISFSFFADPTIPVMSYSETCLQAAEQRLSQTASDTVSTPTDATTIVVGEDVKTPSPEGDYEVLKRVIPVNSTPVDAIQRSSLVTMLSQEPSKKSPNISCINIVAINTAAHQENPYASPRHSSTVTEVSDDSSTPPTNPSCHDSTVPSVPDSSTANPSSDAPSPDCATPPCQDTPAHSTVSNPSTITISLPQQLTDNSVTGCQDWETITDYSDYYDMKSVGPQRRQASSDYEDVQQDYSDPRQRRATLMRDRRRRMGVVRTRIRRAWRAVRGWLGEEKVRLGDVIQRHAHAQAVRKDEGSQQAEEENDSSIVVMMMREDSRPHSRAGLRRNRHFIEVTLSLLVIKCDVKLAWIG